jgi:hypothetical protein
MQFFNLMRRGTWFMGISAALAMCATIKVKGADAEPSDPILDLFVQKGFVTQQEADKVKAEAEALRTNEMQMPQMPESKWNIGKGFKNVELYGDVRLRYEDRKASDTAENGLELQRWRYAVRFGLRGDLFDDFYYGFRLDTSPNPRSPFVTFGTASTTGPFGKSGAGVNIGQVFLGWRPESWVDVTLGKMPMPLYTTPMVWNSNISPEGAAERFKYTVGEADFFATFGQFLYADYEPAAESGGFGVGNPVAGDDIFQLAWQAGLKYNFTTNVNAKIAATLYEYIGLHPSSNTLGANINPYNNLSPYYGDPYVGEGAYLAYSAGANSPGYNGGGPNTFAGYQSAGSQFFNQVGLNHLLVLEIPFEFNFKVKKLDARVFGDFAYNLEGAMRAQDAANAYSYLLNQNITGNAQVTSSPFQPQTSDVKAYQIGFAVGSSGSLGLVNGTNARKNAWEFRTYWQHIEQYSLDPNILDTDFFNGLENMEGYYTALSYGLTDNLIGTVRYGHASRINPLLGTGGSSQDIPQINPVNKYDIIQVDLTLTF